MSICCSSEKKTSLALQLGLIIFWLYVVDKPRESFLEKRRPAYSSKTTKALQLVFLIWNVCDSHSKTLVQHIHCMKEPTQKVAIDSDLG